MKKIAVIKYGPLSNKSKDKLDKLNKVKEDRLRKIKEDYDSEK